MQTNELLPEASSSEIFTAQVLETNNQRKTGKTIRLVEAVVNPKNQIKVQPAPKLSCLPAAVELKVRQVEQFLAEMRQSLDDRAGVATG